MKEYNVPADIKEWSKNAEAVYQRLQDDESRFLFEAKIRYMFNPSKSEWVRMIGEHYNDWNPPKELKGHNHVIIYGSGKDGQQTCFLLQRWGIDVECFCDTFIRREDDKSVMGKKVINVKEAVDSYGHGFFVIASSLYKKKMYESLIELGVDKADIYFPPYGGAPVASRGAQYFDLFEPDDAEVFIDGGAYDGSTTEMFFDWAGSGEHYSYMFEPIRDQYNSIDKKIMEDKRVKPYCAALWDKCETLYFVDNGANSKMDKSGDDSNAVNAVSIDSLVKIEKVTYMKLDIEGTEKEALWGARDTITKDKPKLAICVYHKNNDVVELGSLILSMVPEYKFYLRHYASNHWETVLYASV